MKKLTLLFILSFLGFLLQAQDTIKLTPQELFDYNSKWNNLGTTQSYVDYSKDILSSSDISLGYVNNRLSTTLNLSYNITSNTQKWNHAFITSINPIWKYYGIGYGISKTKKNRVITLQTIGSCDFVFQKNITVSFIDVINTKKFGKFGYNFITSKTFWGEWEGPWDGQFIVDSSGNWVSNIYPINPPSSQLTARVMLMYTYPIKTKRVDIAPQIFTTGDLYKVYRSSDLNISYWDDFNLDIYYGLSMNWKITKKFVLNTNVRLNNTIDNGTTLYKKSNLILFMVGTSFKL
jgi:hypothetical protein